MSTIGWLLSRMILVRFVAILLGISAFVVSLTLVTYSDEIMSQGPGGVMSIIQYALLLLPVTASTCPHYLYFQADDGVHGVELWVSDGTAGGTFRLTEIRKDHLPPEAGPIAPLWWTEDVMAFATSLGSVVAMVSSMCLQIIVLPHRSSSPLR